MIPTWFNSMARVWDVGISAAVMLFALIAMVRLFGKRSTSKMNNFDWIVTVAVGAIVSSAIVLTNVSITDGLVGVTTLLSIQWVLHFLVERSPTVCRMVKASPRLVFDRGSFLSDAMKGERLSEAEVLQAMREHGVASKSEVAWVVMEADASLSVVPHEGPRPDEECWTLENVESPR